MATPPRALRVLVVEDEPTIAITLADELRDHGCRVLCVANGGDAVELLRDHAFDAVITDLRLPGADGIAVARAARRHHPVARVLVMSAGRVDDDALAAAGAEAFLAKPFLHQEVLAWLHGGGGSGHDDRRPRCA